MRGWWVLGWVVVALWGGEAGGEDIAAWAASHARPITTVVPQSGFDDLEPLRQAVGDARVVMLGESRHDAREHFLLKHRLIEFLIEEMGFTVLAMEESVPQAMQLNEYLHDGVADPAEQVAQMGGWYVWGTEEVLALLRWLRQRNDVHGAEIEFHGLDISDAPRAAVRRVLDYLRGIAPDRVPALEEAIDLSPFSRDFWPETLENYGRLAPVALDSLGRGLDRLVDTVGACRPSELREHERMAHLAQTARRAHAMYRTIQGGSYAEGGMVREEAMAANLERLITTTAEGKRIIVWAHNLHIARGRIDIDIPGRPEARDVRTMGQLLAERTAEAVLTVGFTFHHGRGGHADLPAAGPETLDAVLARVGQPLCWVDLREAPSEGAAHAWLHAEQTMRAQGGMARLVPAEAFDLLMFTETIDRTRPTPEVRRRFDALRRR